MCPLDSQAHNYSFFLSVSGISGSTQKHDLGESSSLWMLPSPTAPPEALPLELFLGIQRSQQREVKKNIAATFCARKGWVLAVDSLICCLCSPLSASSPLELPSLSMLITGPQNHLTALQPSVRLVYTMMLPFHPRRRCFLPLSLFPGS